MTNFQNNSNKKYINYYPLLKVKILIRVLLYTARLQALHNNTLISYESVLKRLLFQYYDKSNEPDKLPDLQIYFRFLLDEKIIECFKNMYDDTYIRLTGVNNNYELAHLEKYYDHLYSTFGNNENLRVGDMDSDNVFKYLKIGDLSNNE